MFPAERRRTIERIVSEQGTVSITELSQRFDVSEMTIHRDLNTLEDMGLLRKIRGGAESARNFMVPTEFSQRMKAHQKEKAAIARLATKFIREGDTIFFGPGTTSLFVARECSHFRDITAYTNGPQVMYELAAHNGIAVHCIGGQLSRSSMAFLGPEAEEALMRLRPDKCFIGAHGVTLEDGIMDPDALTASMKRRIVEVSQEVYLVVTPEKFGHVVSQVSFPLEAVDVLITSSGVPAQYCRALTERGIHCVIAEDE